MRVRLAVVLATVASLAAAAPALAKSADVVDADVQLRLARDGALLVTENLTFDYDGSFEGSYRDIPLRHSEEITDVSVSVDGKKYEPGGNVILGSHDRPGVYGVTPLFDGGARVVWHYQASDEQRTYTISYRVVGGAVAYDDVIDVGWAVWGDEWDFDLDHLTASLTNPALDPANPAYRVWGHPREVEGETQRDPGVARLEASDVLDHTAVEFRVTVPRTAQQGVSAMRHEDGDGLPTILAEEQALDDDFNSLFNRVKRFLANNALLVMLATAALAALALLVMARIARERRTSVPEYLPEPPDEAPPALAYGLATEGADSNDTVLATLLDLVDRGYYETSSATTEDEQLDLALKQRKDRPDGELTDYEKDVLSFFDQLLDGNTVAMSELKDRVPEHSSVWRERWERMTEKLDSAEDGQLGWDLDLNPWRRGLILAVIAITVVTVLCDLSVNENWLLPTLVGVATIIAIASLPARWFKRLDGAYVKRSSQWRAFAHWTEDFPRLSDDPPATLELWRRILVYGVAFGTAERMISSGRIPAPVAEASSSSGSWSSYVFLGGFHSGSFSGSAFSSGFASQVAPESSSSGGGGGFSGGGGGFSGGGGGGSW
jgi:uncharacterized membrane protein